MASIGERLSSARVQAFIRPGRRAGALDRRPWPAIRRRRSRSTWSGRAASEEQGDQLARDRHERTHVAQPVRVKGRERVQVGLREAPERHGQDVELARLDEREEQGERPLELGDLDLERGLRPAALAERTAGPVARSRGALARTEPGAITGTPTRRTHQFASSASLRSSPTRGPAARPGSGSARRSVASSRRPPPDGRRLGVLAQPRERAPETRADAGQAARSTFRIPGPANTRRAATGPCGPCRRRGGVRRAAARSFTPSARSVATTSRPWRRSATCIASNSAVGSVSPGRQRRSLRGRTRAPGARGTGGP